MKTSTLSSFALALIGALALAFLVRANPAAAETSRAPIQLRVDVDRGVLPAGTAERAVVKIGLDCLRPPRPGLRPPVNLALVIDRSGSMAGDKIMKAREAALEAVRRLAPDDVVALVVYDTRVQTLVPAQRVGDGRRLEQAIRGIEVAGSTALYGGVVRGAEEVRRNLEDRRFVNRVILLSDGLANVGPSSPEELGRLGTSLRREGVSVTTIGLGLGFNEDLMTRLALCSDGNTYFVEHSADLPRIFAAELGDVLNVVASRVRVEIEFPGGVRPLGFLGREGVVRGQTAEFTLNQLYGGQEKFALVEVEVSPATAGTEIEIARARLSYLDPASQQTETVTVRRNVRFSESRAEVVRSADHQVQADYAANVLAVAKDQVVALVDENRRDEAAEALRQRAREIRAIGELYANPSVQVLAAPAESEADRVARDGLGNSERKTYRAESAQTKNQQAPVR